MNKNIINPWLVFFLLINMNGYLISQDLSFPICGYDHVLHINDSLYPGYRDNVNRHFDFVQRHILLAKNRSEDVFKIPVVIHVVWKNEEENLSDEIIQSQIEVMNEDFRLLNSDKDNIRSIFKDRQSDAGIEFELKEIKRVKTNSNFALSLTGLPDNVKRPANGGSAAVNPDRHLNIWICRIQPIPFIGGQILGYAYPPAGLDNWPDGVSAPSPDLDGVVIDYRAVGKNNPYPISIGGTTIFSEGRTATHEIGHYLGLRHIWGDGGGIFGGESCSEDDGIKDTPNQGRQSPFNCDKSQNTCTDPTGDEPDMIENYMDYSDQLCQNSFTKGQIDHMRSVIMLKRQGIISSEINTELAKSPFVSPNPSRDIFNVYLPDYFTDSDVKIYITDINGRLLNIQQNQKQQNLTIDLSAHPAGIYVLSTVNQNFLHTIRLIKIND
ncbi:MAG: T9SS type A sorting domain-containing protein [Saprospiraceae bacterium]|nr:T9SS type A sorting domain-containing protein [Saprospiraceae bacterium]